MHLADRTPPKPMPGDWRRQLLLIALVALVLRGLALTAMAYEAGEWRRFPYRSDGSAYIANAQRINGGEITPREYDRRGFIGFPWVIAMVQRVTTDYGATAQTLGLVFGAAMCVIAAAWLRDVRIGWAMAILPPHFVLDTSAVLNESFMLSLCMVGLWLCQRGTWRNVLIASLVFGAAAAVRPMACFAVAGAIALLWEAKRPRESLAIGIGSLGAFAALMVTFTLIYWNPLDNAHVYQSNPTAYGGDLFTYPFGSFVHVIQAKGIRFNLIYKAFYMLAAIAVAMMSIVAWKRTRAPLDAAMTAWWITNLAFATCIGSHWGVDIAHRSLAWAAPAAFYTLREWLPVKWYWRLTWAMLPVPFVFVTSQG